MGNIAQTLRAKAGGLADVSASLVAALFELGADVHVALPHYRRMFNIEAGKLIDRELRAYREILSDARIHLAEDRIFHYRDEVYSCYHGEGKKLSLAFQREVINNILPKVDPDLIHCNDWMTGLVPAMARRTGVPCLFTVHNIHTQEITLSEIEDRGIDAAEFWTDLYYVRPSHTYEETRWSNPVDLLTSGIFAAHFVNTVSPTFLREVCEGRHRFVPDSVRRELANKLLAGCAFGILNAPNPSFNPRTDPGIEVNYSWEDHAQAKRKNKLRLQERLGLAEDPTAALFFWPSRLDPTQKGPQLLAEIMYEMVSDYWESGLQIAVIANGSYQRHFHDIARFHDLHGRVAVCDFDENLSRLGYAAADFMIMPSLFEPCGLPQMIGSIYGCLPVVSDTGGLHDTVSPLDVSRNEGNGFVFEVWDPPGLRWAMDRAMDFYRLPSTIRKEQIARIMRESEERFNHAVTAKQYIDLYEKMLRRPLIGP
ncbi:glycosyltransferase [Candidatus Fermentibacteria bacterium]|nr:glycosyltransferase [Candidatus Fermentibacteria bacterium]